MAFIRHVTSLLLVIKAFLFYAAVSLENNIFCAIAKSDIATFITLLDMKWPKSTGNWLSLFVFFLSFYFIFFLPFPNQEAPLQWWGKNVFKLRHIDTQQL